MVHPAAKDLDQSFQLDGRFISLRQAQGPANGLHEEPKSPSDPGKLLSEECWSLSYTKKKKSRNANMPFSMAKISFLPGAASPVSCSLTCLACVLSRFT